MSHAGSDVTGKKWADRLPNYHKTAKSSTPHHLMNEVTPNEPAKYLWSDILLKKECIPLGCILNAAVSPSRCQYQGEWYPPDPPPPPPKLGPSLGPDPWKEHGTRQEVASYPSPANRRTFLKTLSLLQSVKKSTLQGHNYFNIMDVTSTRIWLRFTLKQKVYSVVLVCTYWHGTKTNCKKREWICCISTNSNNTLSRCLR